MLKIKQDDGSSDSEVESSEEQEMNKCKQQKQQNFDKFRFEYKQQEKEDKLKYKKIRKHSHIVLFLNTKINLKKIIINLSDTQYSVISQVAQHLNWKIQTKRDSLDWDIFWTDSAIMPDMLFKMHFFQKINHYPGMYIIARKNLLGLNLMTMREKFGGEYNFFPLTWMLPSQFSQFRHFYQIKKGNIFIAKPQAQSQGKGIFLTKNIQELTNGRRYVLQQYIKKPYLIDSLKFDFRIYVLLSGTQPLRVYLYQQGLVRFATQSYKQPSANNLNDMCMHLTNYAINKSNSKFIFNTSQKKMNIGHKRSLTSVFKLLEKNGHDIQKIKDKINDLIIKTLISGLPLINHQYQYCQPQQYSGNMCFQILGFDILLTNELQPLLLEVNHTPSFTTDTPLDHFIKFNIIKDTLILMNINEKKKKDLLQKAKNYNAKRLFTGKRRIYQGIERQIQILKAQKQRDQYEQKNIGGFKKIYPSKQENLNKKYMNLLQYAKRMYLEKNTLRSKILKQQKMKEKNKKIQENELTLKSKIQIPSKIHQNTFLLSPKVITQAAQNQVTLQYIRKINSDEFDDQKNNYASTESNQNSKFFLSDRIKSRIMIFPTQNLTNISSILNQKLKIPKSLYLRPYSTSRKELRSKSKILFNKKSQLQESSKKKLGNFIQPKLFDLNHQNQLVKTKTLMLSIKYGNNQGKKIPYIISQNKKGIQSHRSKESR